MALIPFLITTGVIISAFAQMFYIGSKNSSYCDEVIACKTSSYCDEVIAIPEKEWLCNTSNQYKTIYGTLYAMLLEGVEVDRERDRPPLTKGLSYLFGFIIGLFFLNVLIAKISNVFTTVEGLFTMSWNWNRNWNNCMGRVFYVLLEGLVFGRVSNEQIEVEDKMDAFERNMQDRIKDLERHIKSLSADKSIDP
jgi:hypothetical protein